MWWSHQCFTCLAVRWWLQSSLQVSWRTWTGRVPSLSLLQPMKLSKPCHRGNSTNWWVSISRAFSCRVLLVCYGRMAQVLCHISFFDPVCWEHGAPTQLIWKSPMQHRAEGAQKGVEHTKHGHGLTLLLGRHVCCVCYKLPMTSVWLG